MTSLATANKLSHVTAHAGSTLVDGLVQTYLAGLQSRSPQESTLHQ